MGSGRKEGREDKRKGKSGREKEQNCSTTDPPSCLRVQHLGKVLPRVGDMREEVRETDGHTCPNPDSSAEPLLGRPQFGKRLSG